MVESACNAGDLGSTLGWEDPLEEGMATHSSILAWRIPWTEEPSGYSPWGHKELDPTEVTACTFKTLGMNALLDQQQRSRRRLSSLP